MSKIDDTGSTPTSSGQLEDSPNNGNKNDKDNGKRNRDTEKNIVSSKTTKNGRNDLTRREKIETTRRSGGGGGSDDDGSDEEFVDFIIGSYHNKQREICLMMTSLMKRLE